MFPRIILGAANIQIIQQLTKLSTTSTGENLGRNSCRRCPQFVNLNVFICPDSNHSMTRTTFTSLLAAASMLLGACASQKDYTQYVDTRIGTDSSFGLSHGNTYPMTARPFGMHGWSPQTGLNGDGWKYTYSADEIRGFQQVHQCSPWMGDYAVISLFPETGSLVVNSADRGSKFSHDNEVAQVSCYKVTFDNGITTEIAPGERSAHLRFTYPEGDAYMVFDGYVQDSQVTIDPENGTLTGWVNNNKFVGDKESFRSWFVIRFDRPVRDFGTWSETGGAVQGEKEGKGSKCGAYLKFDGGQTVTARVASSYISLEQAQLNMDRELGKTFDATRKDAAAVWNRCLGQIDVSGASDEEIRTFYSCLWRSNLFSRKFYEIREDGSPYYYSPYDGKIHDGYMFTDNGFWDTFRSQFPLTNILHPEQQGQYMNALLAAQEQCGWLPSWSAPGETGGMLGNHAISLLCDAWAKGIRSFDAGKALAAYEHEAKNKGPWGGANGRAGYQYYWTIGYVPYPESMGSTAQTLEYAYDDFCAYNLARMTGNQKYMDMFRDAMYFYRNVFDRQTGFMRAKDKDGNFVEPFDKYAWGGAYCEGDAWHYNWSVFQDVQGLIDLYGSDEKFVEKLDSVFTEPAVMNPGTYGGIIHEMKEMEIAGMGQYAHGNQPIQHMPYLYCYAGQPWKTQYRVRQIMSRLYGSGPQGYPGDEDQGGMSSWYTLSALGIYAVTPGTDQYVIGSPVFQKATIKLESGKKFTILADNNSPENVYIQSAELDGKPLDKNWISYFDIAKGGTLHLVMGPEPNLERNTGKEAAPFSLTSEKHSWAIGPFTRLQDSPVISPDASLTFDCPMTGEKVGFMESDTFNPAAVVRDGKICVLFRAEDNSHQGIGSRTSRIGLATSADGKTMTVNPTPVLFPADDDQKEMDWPGGTEDPRVAVTPDGTYVMLYTSWNRRVPRLCVATSRDLLTWEKHGPAFAKAYDGRFKDMACKSGSIVTSVQDGTLKIATIGGRYLMYWGEQMVNTAWSDDLVNWTPDLDEDGNLLAVVLPRPGHFDSALTECGPPAVLTKDGIILMYNGKNATGSDADPRYTKGTYSAGQVLFSATEPGKVLDRLDVPFFKPEADFEKSGQYPAGTVFIEGLVLHRDRWYLYYGCADSFVGAASSEAHM